jgi:hypothetical protein
VEAPAPEAFVEPAVAAPVAEQPVVAAAPVLDVKGPSVLASFHFFAAVDEGMAFMARESQALDLADLFAPDRAAHTLACGFKRGRPYFLVRTSDEGYEGGSEDGQDACSDLPGRRKKRAKVDNECEAEADQKKDDEDNNEKDEKNKKDSN